jgi:hypothetical protein
MLAGANKTENLFCKLYCLLLRIWTTYGGSTRFPCWQPIRVSFPAESRIGWVLSHPNWLGTGQVLFMFCASGLPCKMSSQLLRIGSVVWAL